MSLSPCTEWTGSRDYDGYGHRRAEGKTKQVHRLAWEAVNGPIPPGMCVCHRCDNPPCINVDHLFLGTHADNMADMMSKGRHVPARHYGEANGSAKLTESAVSEIRASTDTQRNLAARFGVSSPTISNIRRGKTWPHVQTTNLKGT